MSPSASTWSSVRGPSFPSWSNSLNPMMPFSGVRSSWETLARKRLLATVAERAASSAGRSCSFLLRNSMAYCSTLRAATAATLRSVTSSSERIVPVISPRSLRIRFSRISTVRSRAVVEHIFALERAGLLPGLHAAHHGLAGFFLPLRRHEIPGEAADHLLRRTLQERAHRLVEARDHALQVGLFVGDRRPVEKIAVAALADAQFPLPLAQQIGGVFQLIAERGDLVRPLRQRLERQSVRQAARILLHRLQAPHHAAGQQQVNEQGAQRAQDPADDHRAEQAPARLIAVIPRLCE